MEKDNKANNGLYRKFFKRPMDLILSLIASVILSPVLVLVAMLVRIKLGSPILFKQQRPGLNEEIFTMYKFRTMTDDKNVNGELLSDSERLTSIGKMLRITSLDELPELFNILKGDMSLVGPRPLAVIYLPYYNRKEKFRHTERPGLTGLAQINGRNTVDWEERFSYDIKYIENISFSLDIQIIFSTLIKVLKKDGVKVRGTTQLSSFHIYRQAQIDESKEKLDY